MASQQIAQDFVPVKEVRDGIVILEDGSMKAVLMVSSLNFALKSVGEQEAILFQFQNFLNSLDFSTQFFVQSRRLNIKPYISMLQEKMKEQTNELVKIQTNEYIGFVRNFTDNVNIMSKNFFVVVSYTPTILQTKKGFMGGLFGGSKKEKKGADLESFQEHRTQLEQRIAVVEQGIARTGVRTVLLGTEEVVELLYKIFNPGESQKPAQVN